jgi:predicted ABC-type ATPase
MTKKIIIIAGPNGAGKTTFARSFLPQEAQCPRFINADLIAAGLSPFAPEAAALKAGRVMLAETAIARVAERVRQGGHHIDETVIRRRFSTGRRNLEQAYKAAVDTWAEYDNVGEEPTLLQWGENR